MFKTSLRVLCLGLMISMTAAACGNDGDDKTVTPPTPTPNPNPQPNPQPSTAFAFGNQCVGEEGECGDEGQCVSFEEGGNGICTGECGSNDEAGWTICANNQTGNLDATAACLVGDGTGALFCAALCGSFEDPEAGLIEFGTCDANFNCLTGSLEGDGSVDLSQVGICG